MGTKQGGEFSPSLFGIFIEQLHELLSTDTQGKGPIIGSLHVPDLMYADDVGLFANSPADLQALLDTLHLFCKLFGMKVNIPKTVIVVFRKQQQKIPSSAVWFFDGQQLKVVPDFKYLGIVYHSTKGIRAAVEHLSASGTRAMHSLLMNCSDKGIKQPAFKLRLFKVLVEPILSYGCQIWGPDLCIKHWGYDRALHNTLERVQLNFLRIISGLPKTADSWVVLKEHGTHPLQHHWIVLCARFWRRVLDMPYTSISHQTMMADIMLFLSGCDTCWVAKLLHILESIGVPHICADRDHLDVDSIVELPITEDIVKDCISNYLDNYWSQFNGQCPSTTQERVVSCTYHNWVGSRKDGAPYLASMLNSKQLYALTRLRVGSFDLHIHTGRFIGTPRTQRLCMACNATYAQVEDLRHFLLFCPEYKGIRKKYASVFTHKRCIDVLAHHDQATLANCVLEMLRQRRESISINRPHITVDHHLDSFSSDDDDDVYNPPAF